LSDTAQDVRVCGVRYRVHHGGCVEYWNGFRGGRWVALAGPEACALIRRIAELEEERERYRKLLEDMPPTTWVDFNKRVKEALGSL
jgi:hypothetical protein